FWGGGGGGGGGYVVLVAPSITNNATINVNGGGNGGQGAGDGDNGQVLTIPTVPNLNLLSSLPSTLPLLKGMPGNPRVALATGKKGIMTLSASEYADIATSNETNIANKMNAMNSLISGNKLEDKTYCMNLEDKNEILPNS
ncbi:MAG: hypothetical protein QXL94_02855, partial [Candidatus Parvarchaeum sp.]